MRRYQGMGSLATGLFYSITGEDAGLERRHRQPYT